MHRLVATVLVSALLLVSGSSAMQHVHAYGDHEHGEHHHGPAVHEHHEPAAFAHHPDADTPQPVHSIEACGPGTHAMPVVFTSVAPPPDHIPLPALAVVFALVPVLTTSRTTPPADVRAHSPPRLTDAPLRAPPLVTRA